MRIILPVLAATAAAVACPASAQSPAGRDLHLSPWWMREAVIGSIGFVETEAPTNRATFTASFQAVARTSAEANTEAAEKARGLARTLQALGAERVRVETSLFTRPLYQQYRDRDGNVQTNAREDQVERYAATATVAVEVRDIGLVQRVYNQVVAAKPAATSSVSFSLEPDNETKTQLYAAAVRDAARRARLATEAAGGRLGAVRVIDPTGRACETDVLAGVNTGRGHDLLPESVALNDIVVTGQARRPAAPPPPPPPAPQVQVETTGGGSVQPEAALPLQPPLQKLTATACVIYALAS